MGIFKRRPRPRDSQGFEIERRKADRFTLSQLPALKSARLLAGPEVQLVNISRGGALFESGTRILPGASICIRLVATDALFFLRGRVLQSRASSLEGSELVYQCRVAFDEEFSLLPANMEQCRTTHTKKDLPAGKIASPTAESWPGVLEEGPNSMLTLTVPVSELECDLPQMFGQ